jgi:ferritin
MISKKMQHALNKQINAEFYSSYLYLSMSSYFEDNKYAGFAHWMRLQAQEELMHAMKIYTFIHDRGGSVELSEIKAPPKSWKNPLEVFKQTLEHEKSVSNMIYDLVDLANKENDHAVHNFLQWFITEQVEEEASTSRLLDQFEMVESAPGGVYMLDRELGGRSLDAE